MLISNTDPLRPHLTQSLADNSKAEDGVVEISHKDMNSVRIGLEQNDRIAGRQTP